MRAATMDAQHVRQVGKDLSNWGKWGPDDQRGTLNYITPEKLKAAGRLVAPSGAGIAARQLPAPAQDVRIGSDQRGPLDERRRDDKAIRRVAVEPF